MRSRLASLLPIALASLSVGCGNDEGDVADPQPYGGEVLIHHLRFSDGSEILRLSAYFIAAQNPDVAPADVPLGQCGPDRRYIQGDSREYIDVGESVTFHLGDGDFVVPRQVTDPDNADCASGTACAEGVVDFYDRKHEIAYLSEVGGPRGDGFLLGEDSVTTAEPQSFNDQLRVVQPPVMQVESPGLDESGFLIALDQDVELTWQPTEAVDDLTVNITFVPDAGTITTTCRVPDTGSFTVPHDVIEGLEADNGVLFVDSVSRATVVTEEGRSIDVVAEYHGNLFPYQRR